MFKKIGLYTLLFIVVTLSTATVVVFMNKQPNVVKNEPVISEQEMTLTNIMNATMTMENYYASFILKSDDNDIDLSGAISILDLAGTPSANCKIKGNLLSKEVNISIKYKDSVIYFNYNGFGIKVLSGDVVEIFEIVYSLISDQTSKIDFNIESLLSNLEKVQIEETAENYNLSIEIPSVGPVNIKANKNYLPIWIEANEISLFGKNLQFSLNAHPGKASSVSLSYAEQNDYINLSNSKNLIKSIINTFTKSTTILEGYLDFFGVSIGTYIFIDKDFNVKAKLTLGNLLVELYYYDKYIYINALGTKIKCELSELLELAGTYFNIDGIFNDLNLDLSETNFSISGFSFDFVVEDNHIRQIKMSQTDDSLKDPISGVFNVSNFFTSSIVPPQNYEDAFTVNEIKDLLYSYLEILQSDEYSFIANGNLEELNFDLNGYILMNNQSLKRVFFGGKISNNLLNVWYKNGYTYVASEIVRVKFNNAFSSNMLNYLSTVFNIQIPTEVNLTDIVDLLSGELEILNIEKDGTIYLKLKTGIELTINKSSDSTTIKIVGSMYGKSLNTSICLFKETDKNKIYTNMLLENVYEDFSDYADESQAVLNTLMNDYNLFSGELIVRGLCNIADWVKLGIKIETWYKNGKLEFCIEISNFPTTCIFTDTSVFNYKKQSIRIFYKDGNLNVKRIGIKTFGGDEELRFEKNYKLKDLSVSSFYEIFGFGGIMGNKIKKMLDSASEKVFDLNELLSLKKVDNQLTVSVQASKLMKQIKEFIVSLKINEGVFSGASGQIDFGFHVDFNIQLVKN